MLYPHVASMPTYQLPVSTGASLATATVHAVIGCVHACTVLGLDSCTQPNTAWPDTVGEAEACNVEAHAFISTVKHSMWRSCCVEASLWQPWLLCRTLCWVMLWAGVLVTCTRSGDERVVTCRVLGSCHPGNTTCGDSVGACSGIHAWRLCRLSGCGPRQLCPQMLCL